MSFVRVTIGTYETSSPWYGALPTAVVATAPTQHGRTRLTGVQGLRPGRKAHLIGPAVAESRDASLVEWCCEEQVHSTTRTPQVGGQGGAGAEPAGPHPARRTVTVGHNLTGLGRHLVSVERPIDREWTFGVEKWTSNLRS